MTNFKTGGPWITRFAPSPTGVLHLGNVRTAILMLMTGLDAWQARDLLAENNDRLRLALQETTRSTLSSVN